MPTTIPPPAHADWDLVAEVLRRLAHDDLVATGGGGGLWLAAAAGEQPLLLAASRPFAKGAHDGPVVELASLALGLGADRIAVAVTGRAWSTDDPVVPVCDAGDLRTRVLCVHSADGHRREAAEVRGVLLPFALQGRRVRWSDPVPADDAEGWIPGSLGVVVTQTEHFVDRPEDLVRQLARCDRLGHRFRLSPGAATRVREAAAG